MAEGKTGFGRKVVVKHDEFGMGGNILEIDAGKKTDMVFHLHTRKVVYVLLGKINVIVLTDGKMAKFEMIKGASFAVKEGLVYQLEAVEKSVVVEFLSHYNEKDQDTKCISRGSVEQAVVAPAAPAAPAANVIMDEKDKSAVVSKAATQKSKGKKKKK